MRHLTIVAAGLLATAIPVLSNAQSVNSASISGTRLDLAVTGTATRMPDVATISAGVVTRAATAGDALAQNAARIERVRAALRQAGVLDRDVQTNAVSLSPDYVYAEGQPPRLTGYGASNQLSVRFRDIRSAGRIIDTLVAQGANQINGPTLSVDRPEAALDEARTKALASGRERAALYARSLGMRVLRLAAVSESGGGGFAPAPMVAMRAERGADTAIVPGQQELSITLQMTFELQ